MNEPYSLAFHGHDDLYVANLSANTVTLYARNRASVRRTISEGLTEPNALRFGP